MVQTLFWGCVADASSNAMSGGWLSGGPAGDLKMSVPMAFTTSLLAWGMLAFPSGYAAANQTHAGQQSVRWGADYLLKTLIANSTGGNVSSIVYQVLITSAADICKRSAAARA